jgi:hypothetical protein
MIYDDETALLERAQRAREHSNQLIELAKANRARACELRDEAEELDLEAHIAVLSARHLLMSQAQAQNTEHQMTVSSTAPPDLPDCLAGE